MGLIKKSEKQPDIYALQSARSLNQQLNFYSGNMSSFENRLYEQLRIQVPVIDACIQKIVRLCGDFTIKCSDEQYQDELDEFVNSVRVGISGQSLNCFVDSYLDSLLTYGNAVGEILINSETRQIAGLYNADSTIISAR